jgi:hypothetical protein
LSWPQETHQLAYRLRMQPHLLDARAAIDILFRGAQAPHLACEGS